MVILQMDKNINFTGEKRVKRSDGFTLIEVVASLLIISVMASLGLSIYMGKYRSFFETKKELEQGYALYRGLQAISEAIRSAENIEWLEIGVLIIYQMDEDTPAGNAGQVMPDKFYIDDKDHDGKTDLYKEHLGVPSPIATGLGQIRCKEESPGLWEVKLSLSSTVNKDLKLMVRQRTVNHQ